MNQHRLLPDGYASSEQLYHLGKSPILLPLLPLGTDRNYTLGQSHELRASRRPEHPKIWTHALSLREDRHVKNRTSLGFRV